MENLKTNRLKLNILAPKHAEFILELVNTDGWKKFIGERNINSNEESLNYIQRISDNQNITYWAVERIEDQVALGIITLIKRDYLENRDLGFAFLPSYAKQGYAFEASKLILENLDDTKMDAITISENKNSIDLLLKLGFEFEKKIRQNEEDLDLYSINNKK
jgi:[ribosomal protein S5]-alanine N-acetyltransferase